MHAATNVGELIGGDFGHLTHVVHHAVAPPPNALEPKLGHPIRVVGWLLGWLIVGHHD